MHYTVACNRCSEENIPNTYITIVNFLCYCGVLAVTCNEVRQGLHLLAVFNPLRIMNDREKKKKVLLTKGLNKQKASLCPGQRVANRQIVSVGPQTYKKNFISIKDYSMKFKIKHNPNYLSYSDFSNAELKYLYL